ncbi:PREDICTED: LOC110744488 [Prunus dulcis]|uniref:PREDICTED: LOC110744488 n=1 Tax=Prunus dulcis TaxID=3755 RepID=A0A5E4GIH7_PRUDU|nr:PREDICTED: LOC110744488 [Prunus dulcis]
MALFESLSSANSLDSSLGEEVEGLVKKRKRKLPKVEDFRLETDFTNLMFKIDLTFPSVQMFRRVVRNYFVLNMRVIRFTKMIEIRRVMGLDAFGVDPNNRKYPENGLMDSVGDLFPNLEHRPCLKHLIISNTWRGLMFYLSNAYRFQTLAILSRPK